MSPEQEELKLKRQGELAEATRLINSICEKYEVRIAPQVLDARPQEPAKDDKAQSDGPKPE